MRKISLCLWFNGNAEAAVKFYRSVFKNFKELGRAYYTKSSDTITGKPAGTLLTISFRLEDQEFLALNGGLEFKFTLATSIVVKCRTQAELNRIWKKLSAGAGEGQCGWITDKFGVTWQIVPEQLPKWVGGRNTAKADAVMRTLHEMERLDIKKLKAAYDQG